jgi:putative ABC transport system permease protein
MEHLLKDVRHGVRSLARHPGMSALAVLAIAIGIGTVTTQFSVVHGVLLRGLPFPGGDRIAIVQWNVPRNGPLDSEIAIQDFVEMQRQQTSFETLAAFYSGTVNLRLEGGMPVRVHGGYLSSAAFSQLGVQPVLGRDFAAGEDQPGAAPVMLLNHALWQREFAGDPGVIGRTAWANGRPRTIVGVMPAGFSFPGEEEVWLTLSHDEALAPRGRTMVPSLAPFGRLRSGVDADRAAAELSSIAHRLAEAYPETNRDYTSVKVQPFVDRFTEGEVAVILWAMLFAGFLVLAVACANVANILFAQAAKRTKEFAVRSALGASRRRLVAQMLTEGLALSVIGAVLGIGLAHLGNRAIWGMVEKLQPPFWMRFEIAPPVLFFVVGITLFTTLLSGLVPALHASRADVNSTLKDDTRTGTSLLFGIFARILVIVQIAFSGALLALALLMAKSSFDGRSIKLPFEPAEIFSARIALFDTDYPTETDRARFFQRLGDALAADPGVGVAAYSGNYRFFGSGRGPVRLDDGSAYESEKDMPRVRREIIGGDYFTLLNAPLLEGRMFTAADYELGAPRVAIVNTTFARRFFAGRSALGARFAQSRAPDSPWITIVGVAPDLHMQGVDPDPDDGSGYYVPFSMEAPRFMTVLLRPRVGGDPATMATLLRRVLQPLDANLPIYEAVTLDKNLDEQLRGFDIFSSIFAGLGVAALLLASIGVYGVMSFAVAQRRQEIGIRMALGASGPMIMRMVFTQGGRQVAIGLGCALVLAVGLGWVISRSLENVSFTDVRIYACVVVVLGAVGLLAILNPARRAAAGSPLQALRED